jgi:hypothetical protein
VTADEGGRACRHRSANDVGRQWLADAAAVAADDVHLQPIAVYVVDLMDAQVADTRGGTVDPPPVTQGLEQYAPSRVKSATPCFAEADTAPTGSDIDQLRAADAVVEQDLGNGAWLAWLMDRWIPCQRRFIVDAEYRFLFVEPKLG